MSSGHSFVLPDAPANEVPPKRNPSFPAEYQRVYCLRSISPPAFKSCTSTGDRTVISRHVFVKAVESTPANKKARRRQKKKAQKLQDLLQVVPRSRCLDVSVVATKPAAIFYRYSSTTVKCDSSGSPVLIPRSDTSFTCPYNSSTMTIVDTTEGAVFRNDENKIVFILIPRRCSLDSIASYAADDIKMMETFQKLSPKSKRGTAKPFETRFKCCNSGWNANRGGRGIVCSKNCRDEEAFHTKQLKYLCGRIQRLMGQFLPTQDLRALSNVKAINPFSTLAGSDTESIFPTASMSVDYCSAAHVDIDFFFSLLAIRSVHNKSDNFYQANTDDLPPVAQHFVFPTVGIAVALRPGDHLIFNPKILHCCSEKLIEYTAHRVHLCAFYLKTAIIGMNDNSKPLTSSQEQCNNLIKLN